MTTAAPPSETDDVVALWRLQARYADVVTRQAWPELAELFLPGTPLHLDLVTSPVREIVGPDQIGPFIATAIERFDHFEFVVLNTVVDVEPGNDEARGRIFMCEIRHLAEPSEHDDGWTTAYGCYQDRYRRVDGRWWFAERHYRSMARTGREGAILGIPPGLGPLG